MSMKRAREEIALEVAKIFRIAIVFKKAGTFKDYDMTWIVYPDGREEKYKTGACSFFLQSNKKKIQNTILNDKLKLKKKLRTIKYMDYKGCMLRNYLKK
jgi:hypothetical protein